MHKGRLCGYRAIGNGGRAAVRVAFRISLFSSNGITIGGLENLPALIVKKEGWKVTFQATPKTPQLRGKPGINQGFRFIFCSRAE
jgi:hypothetical protein